MRLKPELRQEFATVRNNIVYPIYGGDRLHPRDETLIQRGGRGWRAWDVYTDIARDCHAYSVLQKRWMAVVGREWEVKPGGTDAIDQKAADMVREHLTNLSTRVDQDDSGEAIISTATGFDQLCWSQMAATLYGTAPPGEIIWDQDSNEVFPREVFTRDLRRFIYLAGDRTHKLRLLTLENAIDGLPLPARKFIVHRFCSMPTEDPWGLGLGTRLFYPVYFKRNTVKFWLVFADKWASPTAVAKHPRNASKEEKAKIREMLEAIATDSGILIPEGVMVEFLEAQRSGTVSTYGDLVDFCDGEMSKAVLGETGTTDQQGSGGSRARDQVGNEVRIEVAKADSDLLSGTINQTLCRWITEFNLPDAKPPQVWRKFPELEEKEDLGVRASRDKVIVDMSARSLTEDYLVETYGVEFTKQAEDQAPALAASLGVGGTSALMGFLQGLSQGSFPRKNAIATLIAVFGINRATAETMVPDEAPPEPASNPDQPPAIANLLGGDQPAADTGNPVTPPDQPAPDAPAFAEGDQREPDLPTRYTQQALEQSQAIVTDWIDQVRSLLKSSADLSEARDKILDLYPDISSASFAELMGSAIATADLAGRYEVLQEGETEPDLSEPVEFNQRSPGARREKNCRKGYSCGYSCINKAKACKRKLEGQASNYAEWLARQIVTLGFSGLSSEQRAEATALARQNPDQARALISQQLQQRASAAGQRSQRSAPTPPPTPVPSVEDAPGEVQQAANPQPQRTAARLPNDVRQVDPYPGKRSYQFDLPSGRQVEIYFSGDNQSAVVGFNVDGNYRMTTDLPDGDRNRAAIKLMRILKYDATTRPDGFQYSCSAYIDGYEAYRAGAYIKSGFSRPVGGMAGSSQYSVVRNGTTTPDNVRLRTIESSYQQSYSNVTVGTLRQNLLQLKADLKRIKEQRRQARQQSGGSP